MAPSPVDYPTLLSQLPFVSKLATAEQTHPSVRQELFGPLLAEEQRKKEKEVQKINAKDEATTVTRDGSGNAPGQQASEEREKPADNTDDEETETNPSSGSPWTGNIINRKI